MRTDADLYAQILAATELTRQGRLAEAAALIQGTLDPPPDGDHPTTHARPSSRAADVVIDVECVEVADPTGHVITELRLLPPEPGN